MTLSEISLLRHMIDEQTEGTYGNQFLSDLIDANDTLEDAAAQVWSMKAAKYAALVDTSEAGASRKMSQLALQAQKMAEHFGGGTSVGAGGTGSGTMTRAIERA